MGSMLQPAVRKRPPLQSAYDRRDKTSEEDMAKEKAERTQRAVDQVMNTAELRKGIMQHLDNKTLLLSQRVSRTWKLTIESSPCLQEKLFFKLGATPPLSELLDGAPDAINPLLATQIEQYWAMCVAHHEETRGFFEGPAPFRIYYRPFEYDEDASTLSNTLDIQVPGWCERKSTRKIGGSWQRMYLLRPGYGWKNARTHWLQPHERSDMTEILRLDAKVSKAPFTHR